MSDKLVFREISEQVAESSVKHLRKKFWEKEFQIQMELTPEYKKEFIKDDCKVILLNQKTAQELMETSSRLRTEVIEMQFADTYLLKDGKWWLYAFLGESLSRLIFKKAAALDTHRMAYITGCNQYSILAAVTVIKLGFENVTFVVNDLTAVVDKIAHLNRKFFGVNIQTIKDSELTLQPSNGSILINGVFGPEGESLAEDLIYLNFLEKANSMILEICFNKSNGKVLQEAEEVGIPYASSSEVWSYRDFLLLREALPNFSLTFEEYFQKWESFISQSQPSG